MIFIGFMIYKSKLVSMFYLFFFFHLLILINYSNKRVSNVNIIHHCKAVSMIDVGIFIFADVKYLYNENMYRLVYFKRGRCYICKMSAHYLTNVFQNTFCANVIENNPFWWTWWQKLLFFGVFFICVLFEHLMS